MTVKWGLPFVDGQTNAIHNGLLSSPVLKPKRLEALAVGTHGAIGSPVGNSSLVTRPSARTPAVNIPQTNKAICTNNNVANPTVANLQPSLKLTALT